LSDDTISEIKHSYDVDNMNYSIYIGSLVTLAKLDLI
jgi:hypothetical protein